MDCDAGMGEGEMMDFDVLAPELDVPHRRLLKAMLRKAGLSEQVAITEMGDVRARHVLSVGRAATDLWHEFGLVQVGAHHGCVFTHWHPPIGHLVIMQVHHPGTLLQLSIEGHEAKDAMMRNLNAWRMMLEGKLRADDLRMADCAKCAVKRRSKGHFPIKRKAVEWDVRVDAVGLCEDCWRGRAKIVKKEKVKKVKPGTREAQMEGQGEMFVDGKTARVVVGK